MELGILFDQMYLDQGIRKEISWCPDRSPHMMIAGSTGSGKTYFSKILLGKIARYCEDAEIFVADFKADDDFAFLNGCAHYYSYQECEKGLKEFYQLFEARQEGKDTSKHMRFLYFDEWASYLNHIQDKKVVTNQIQMLANILMMGRSYHTQVIMSMQRCDAKYFEGARENFNVAVGLGNMSDESKSMLFYGYKEQMKAMGQGTGYILLNGKTLQTVHVPTVTNNKALETAIRQGVNRR